MAAFQVITEGSPSVPRTLGLTEIAPQYASTTTGQRTNRSNREISAGTTVPDESSRLNVLIESSV